MENQLVEIVNKSGLEKTKADYILEKFQDYFSIASEWETKAKTIIVTNEKQETEMKMARVGRLFLREKRLAIEDARKNLKEQSLREGKAIDGIANVLKALIIPIEEYLEKQERFVEFKKAREEEQKRIEVEKRIEEERIAKEKADAEEREKIKAENERLKQEAEERERKHREEQAKVEAEKRAIEEKARKERESAELKRKEAERKAKAEQERIKQEAEERERKHREEQAKVEAEKRAIEEKARKERGIG